MSLQGELRTVGFEQLVQWLHARRLTGDLSLTRGSVTKRLVFVDGALVFCSSNDPRETLPQVLLRRHAVPLEALLAAMEEQQRLGENLAAILVSHCTIEPADLEAALRQKAEDAVYDLFLWQEASFGFTEQEHTRAMFLDLQLSTRALLEEGARRQKLWREFSHVVPSREATFRRLSRQDVHLSGQAGRVLAAVGPGKTLGEIALETQISDFEAALWLKELCERGILGVNPSRDGQARGDAPESDAVALVRKTLLDAEGHLERRELDAAQRGFEHALALDPVCLRAKRGLLAVSEARHRRTLTHLLPPTKRPSLRRTIVQLANETLSKQEGFVLSRATGHFTVADIVRQCPISEEETLAILSSFLSRGIVELRD